MKEIILINLTRMGDLLQTTPLLAALKQKYPSVRITLIANSAFSGICAGLPHVDHLMLFDMTEYRTRLSERKYSLVENYRYLEGFVQEINTKKYDLVINITHSSVSAVLARLIHAEEIRGFTIDAEGHRVIRHPWMRYFFNVIPNRLYNPFHLVDMYLKIGEVTPVSRGLLYNLSPESDKNAANLLRTEGITGKDMLIGFHLGASKSEKTWPVSSYAELADRISDQTGARIVLFGSKGERDLAREFARAVSRPPVDLVGRTGLGELAAAIRRCSLFVSNDTGPLHIATSVGTKVLDISTANVNYVETGPYGEGHYVIQADLPCVPCGFDVECTERICKSVIRTDAVYEVVMHMLEDSPLSDSLDREKWRGLHVYRSCFGHDGYLAFEPVLQHSLNRELFYRILYREVWNGEVSNAAGNTAAIHVRRIEQALSQYDMGGSSRLSLLFAEKDYTALCKLLNTVREGVRLIELIRDEAEKEAVDAELVRDSWSRLEPLEENIEGAGHTDPFLKPLTLTFVFSREALEEGSLQYLAARYAQMYQELLSRAETMEILMKNLLEDMTLTSERESCGVPAH